MIDLGNQTILFSGLLALAVPSKSQSVVSNFQKNLQQQNLRDQFFDQNFY